MYAIIFQDSKTTATNKNYDSKILDKVLAIRIPMEL